jgi:hypothetical protein
MTGWTVVAGSDAATIRASRPTPPTPRPDPALCGRGLHPWAGDNVYVSPKGVGSCRACRALAMQRYRQRQRERRS